MRISYMQGSRTIRLHGPDLNSVIDQIPDHVQQQYAREIITPNMSGETFGRLMRDKYNWKELIMHDCCGGNCKEAA